ncbi:hypothetical protein EMIHUDRAFT_207472 [Emiliania huxleyi CCMP1516]|uniref:Uncharacterized protein n=2 Tax=Emiliania huxleyi TaxID=2903 RepID=A0A0D3JFK2_EMIH1|nr:hypothetical protein EMIHUDRAFT_207472 [Emiliania huxleyi CCMP1516]EOD22287.1 hypothetical protein EMIHUDRAFT_207472 [Emiliania huxleyi CCMP1516]|eukprot:XP_005774716.1 hypothetical protein EMIHUDRAFT_207472 [Emiliania huxleyi CCMP1516]
MLADGSPEAILLMAEDDEIPEGAPLLESLLQCAASLLDAAGGLLASPEHAHEREALLAAFSQQAVGALHQLVAGRPVALRSLVRIAAHLPANHVPLYTDTLRDIASQRDDAPATVLRPLLQCAVSWNLDAAVLAAVVAALAPSAAAAGAGAKRGRKGGGAKASSSGDAAAELSPALALRVLWSWLENASTRDALLTRTPPEQLAALRDALSATAEAEALAEARRAVYDIMRGQLLLSVLLAEGSALGIYDASLASAVAACVEGALRLAADAGGGGELYTGPLGQLLPHAAKLSYQLVLAVHQHAASDVAPLLGALLRFVASCTLDVLIRSPVCEASLKRCAAELAAEAAAAEAPASPSRLGAAVPSFAQASGRLARALG